MTTNLPVPAAPEFPLEGGAAHGPILSRCSKALRFWLIDENDQTVAIRRIAATPHLLAEAKSMVDELARASEPIKRNDLLELLVLAAPALGVPDRPPEQWAVLFAPYPKTLGELPAMCIDDAFERWHRAEMYPDQPGRHAYYPKPAELFHLAKKSRSELSRAAWRIRQAMAYVDRSPRRKTDDERRREVQKSIDDGVLIRGSDGKLRLNLSKPFDGRIDEDGVP